VALLARALVALDLFQWGLGHALAAAAHLPLWSPAADLLIFIMFPAGLRQAGALPGNRADRQIVWHRRLPCLVLWQMGAE
jgi:hypothetical protein